MLVEEALYNRGMFNIKTGKAITYKENYRQENHIKHLTKDFIYSFKNNIKNDSLNFTETKEELIDNEIYVKFLMFLQFQERMKRRDL